MLGEETTSDIFLSGDSAVPKVVIDQFAGTETMQLPSEFFTGFAPRQTRIAQLRTSDEASFIHVLRERDIVRRSSIKVNS